MAEDFGYVQVSGDEKEASELRTKMNALMEQARATYVPLQKVAPTLATLDTISLEQIRVVMREELENAMKLPLLEGDVPTSEELTEHLKQWKPVVKYREYDPEIEGQPSLTTELVHDGKLYKGVLYFVKDVE